MRIVPTPIVLKTIDAHVRRYLPPPRSRNFPLLLAPLMDFKTTVPKLCSIINKWHCMVTYTSNIIIYCYKFTYKYIHNISIPFSLRGRTSDKWCPLDADVELAIIFFGRRNNQIDNICIEMVKYGISYYVIVLGTNSIYLIRNSFWNRKASLLQPMICLITWFCLHWIETR